MYQKFGFVRIASVVPPVTVGGVQQNVAAMLDAVAKVSDSSPDLIVFPEMCLTGYTCADLFQQQTLVDAAERGLQDFLAETAGYAAAFVVGLPVRSDVRLFNCAAVVQSQHILGVVPKSFLPNYREFYEKRWFSSGRTAEFATVRLCGRQAPFGTNLLFRADAAPEFVFGVELCEDLWAPNPPSTGMALGGATLVVNISASDDQVGKVQYREELIRQQSGRCIAGYAYCSAGIGESTTDLVFGGHCLAAENGIVLARNERFQDPPSFTLADFDLGFLVHERCQNTVFGDGVAEFCRSQQERRTAYRYVAFEVYDRTEDYATLHRPVRPLPFVPGDRARRREICEEIFAIQSIGLATRMAHTGLHNLLLGVSGGLDSTLTLLVCAEACNRLGISHDHIHAVTMPGFGTTDRTLENVQELCRELNVTLENIPIRDSSIQHFKEIGHDGETHDATFENVQARERTQILMDKANMMGALVVGTGDLSELALGWCTYCGDHMSMYAVNTGVPKTLVTFLVEYVAERWADRAIAATLHDILDTPISPELLPMDHNGDIAQRTEDMIGPYELHDFFLFQIVRTGCPPEKVLFLAERAFAESYDRDEIRKWLRMFIKRFFAQQFKRSCMPDGPKVGSVALSPRGDWRMPSDACADEWLRRLDDSA